jgi:hypothetical protein
MKSLIPFVYYNRGTNHKKADDVAVTYAKNAKDAREKFSVYYHLRGEVVKADIKAVNQRQGILIISDY